MQVLESISLVAGWASPDLKLYIFQGVFLHINIDNIPGSALLLLLASASIRKIRKMKDVFLNLFLLMNFSIGQSIAWIGPNFCTIRNFLFASLQNPIKSLRKY